ncbi:MAG: AAA family ATPase [Methylococcaceae bacterium]
MPMIWAVACGGNEEWVNNWPTWRKDGVIAIGYGCNFPLIVNGIELTNEEIKQNGGNGAPIVRTFAFTIRIGDYVVIKRGNSSILGLGKVIGDIEYSESSESGGHQLRKVKWIRAFESPMNIQIKPLFTRTAVHRLGVECGPEIIDITQHNAKKPLYLSRMRTILTTLGLLEKVEMPPTNQESYMQSTCPLNQILYGPPGTGKTYSTVIEALKVFYGFEIIDENEEYEEGYLGDKQRFDAHKSKGNIQFVTFHQSFSYEDFVEGIRAETNAGGALSYSIKDGVFKSIAIEALYSKFEEEYAEQLDYKWQEAKSNNIYQKKITADTLFDPNNYDHKKLILSTCKIADFTAGTGDPYVLIIDEINRGNTSRIFGELITLIEDTKRAGTDEAMDALLPYSQETFTVPDNLYIIGTMNTADRSLALIDTALRRRFDFIEMMPKPELIKDINIDKINLQEMLETINNRIEALYDREHTIGHAFFMKLKKESTIEDLASIFKNKILPLLEEYFFEDWEKITLVLGKSGIYEDKTLTEKQLGFIPSGKNYSRNDKKLAEANTYINIYSANPVQQD